jgi:hypothetical protein
MGTTMLLELIERGHPSAKSTLAVFIDQSIRIRLSHAFVHAHDRNGGDPLISDYRFFLRFRIMPNLKAFP